MSDEIRTDEQIHQAAMEEWLGILAQLWTAIGKPIDADRLDLYGKALEDVPLGLLESAVARVIRENVYSVVPPPGVVWKAVEKELGNPHDVLAAIEKWKDDFWSRIAYRFE
jgi:hypothetical protein